MPLTRRGSRKRTQPCEPDNLLEGPAERNTFGPRKPASFPPHASIYRLRTEQPKRQAEILTSQFMRLIYFIFANALEVAVFALGAAAMICAVSAIVQG